MLILHYDERDNVAAVILLALAGTAAADYYTEVTADSPIPYWQLDETSGAAANGGNIVEYNHMYDGGFLCRDVSLVYTQLPGHDHPLQLGARLPDVRVPGRQQRRDGYPGDNQTRGLTVHHNVVRDVGRYGIIVKGDEKRIFNNTIFDITPRKKKIKQRQDLIIPFA